MEFNEFIINRAIAKAPRVPADEAPEQITVAVDTLLQINIAERFSIPIEDLPPILMVQLRKKYIQGVHVDWEHMDITP